MNNFEFLATQGDTLDPSNEDHHAFFVEVAQRCGRHNTVAQTENGWMLVSSTGEVVDSDPDYNALFKRTMDWEADVPGFEGLLWQSPGRMSGEVCLKGHRLPAVMVAACVAHGDDPFEAWDEITQEQVDAAVRWSRQA
jgi:uncharacterized protein (DUF433 family)